MLSATYSLSITERFLFRGSLGCIDN
jgi:hypothetical protein